MILRRQVRNSKQTYDISVPGQRPLVVEQWVGPNPGPVLFISAGMHGDEVNGVALLQRARRAISIKDLAGTLIFVPVLNLTGFRQAKRCFQPYNVDLNRAFPGSPTGAPVQVLAHTIFSEVVAHSDAGIDLHDAGERNILLPHVRVHRGDEPECRDGCTLDMGRMAGTSIIMQRPGEPGMMAIEAARLLKKPVVTLEIGGGGVLWEEYLTEGVNAVLNILRYVKMLAGRIILPRHQFILGERVDYASPLDGIITYDVELGQPVHTGERLAQVTNPLTNEAQDIVSGQCGVVFALKLQGRVTVRTEVASVLQFGQCPSHPTTPPNIAPQDILINDPGPGVSIITEGTLVHRLPLIIEKEKI